MNRGPRSKYLARMALASAAFVAGAAAFAAGAFAQNIEGQVIYGTPNAAACGLAAANGRASEDAIAACTTAITEERLTRIALLAAHTNRGALHIMRREGAAALADFDRVIALDPRNAEAHVNRGAALIMNGQPGPAVAAITRALSLGVRAPHKAYFNRGGARELLGDLRGAYEDYNTALEIMPDWGPAEAELQRFARGRREQLADAAGAQPEAAQNGGGGQ